MIRTAGRPDMMCVIQNLSNTGAMLNFPNPTILPRVFSMKFDGVELRATVMWQSGRLAGVRFQTPLKGIGAQEKRKWLWSRR
jgi:hypothetical protein